MVTAKLLLLSITSACGLYVFYYIVDGTVTYLKSAVSTLLKKI